MPKFNDFELDLQKVSFIGGVEMLPLSGGEGNWGCVPDDGGISGTSSYSGAANPRVTEAYNDCA